MSFQDAHSPLQKEIDRRVRQRVLDGIELLRKEWGEDWADHIDLGDFDLTDGSTCVLGQLYGGSYTSGLNTLDIMGKGGRYGFDCDDTAELTAEGFDVDELYEDWETIWRQKIAELQGSRREGVPTV